MLQRNRLISEPELRRLREFVDRYDYAVMMLLDGASDREAFQDAQNLSNGTPAGDR